MTSDIWLVVQWSDILSPMRRIAALLSLLLTAGSSVASVQSTAPDQTSDYLDVGGSKIYYEEAGTGSATIVLLHDGLLGSESWNEVWDKLAAKYHVIRYDRRGYGRSEPAKVAFSPSDDLAKLLTHLKAQPAVIVGSSSGGALAIDFAIAHPEMVSGLFLIGPVLHGMRYTEYFLARAHRNVEPFEKKGDIKAAIKNWSEDRFLIANGHDQARKKFYDALLASSQNLKYDPQFEKKLSPPASQRLAEIKAPTLILAGESDIADVHAHCGAINTGIRDSQRVVLKDAGHLVQLDCPDEVVRQLIVFATKIAESR